MTEYKNARRSKKLIKEAFLSLMKEKPVLPLILSMSLPMVLSMMVNSLYNIVDSFFVAQINEDAMTALSLVYPLQNLINAVAIGFGVGINAQIAFQLGADNKDRASAAATRGLLLAAIHGLILSLVCIAAIRWFLGMFTADQTVINLGVRYSVIAFSFSVVISVGLAFEKIFQAVGRMKLTMLSMLSGCVANIILDPVLIFGLGPFPELGIEGAAIATGAGQVLTLAVYLTVYRKVPIPVRISRRHLSADRQMDAKLYSVGIPAALNLALPSVMISALNTILAAWSQSYIVILGVYYKLQTFLYLPGERARVHKIYRVTLIMCAVIMVAGTLVCLTVPHLLIGLFTENPETIQTGAAALRIISAGFIVSSVSVTSSGALEGIGKGFPSLIISLCRYIVVILPAAFILSRLMGPSGVWHAFWATELITAVVSFAVYRRAAVLPD